MLEVVSGSSMVHDGGGWGLGWGGDNGSEGGMCEHLCPAAGSGGSGSGWTGGVAPGTH